jgi:hypothetical protein
MTDTLQIIISVAGVGVTVILALVAGIWHLRGRLDRMESRLEHMSSRISDLGTATRSLNQQVALIVGILPTAFMFLHRSQAMTDEEYHQSMGQFSSHIAQSSGNLIDYLARHMNPLTSDEVRRLKELLDKARRAELFTREEAKEYDSIVRKVEAELPDDYRVWLLVTLAKFMKGLYPDLQRNDAQ